MSAEEPAMPDLSGLVLYARCCRDDEALEAEYLEVLVADAFQQIGQYLADRLRRKAAELRAARPVVTGKECGPEVANLCLEWRELTQKALLCEQRAHVAECHWVESGLFDDFVEDLGPVARGSVGDGGNTDIALHAMAWAKGALSEWDGPCHE